MVNEYKEGQEPFKVLNKNGVLEKNMPEGITDKDILDIYKDMKFFRKFDDQAVKLQRKGELGTYPELKGHEGIHIGSYLAMEEEDWVVPTYREQGIKIKRGVPPEDILLYWGGDERGHDKFPENNIMPISVPIGSHIPHATGIGFGLKEEKGAALCYFGDGATSEGAFHEGINFSSVLKTPTVFVCCNNQYAISTSIHEQMNTNTIAQKSQGYGISGYLVDGMDPLAVYEVIKETRDKAENKNEPSLVELVTYRLGPHTTSDDPSRYRNEEEKKKWEQKNPIKRIEKYIIKNNLFEKSEDTRIKNSEKNKAIKIINKQIEQKVEKVINKYHEYDKPDKNKIIQHTYDKIQPHLQEQKKYLGDNNE